jgi:hypothetical protein
LLFSFHTRLVLVHSQRVRSLDGVDPLTQRSTVQSQVALSRPYTYGCRHVHVLLRPGAAAVHWPKRQYSGQKYAGTALPMA